MCCSKQSQDQGVEWGEGENGDGLQALKLGGPGQPRIWTQQMQKSVMMRLLKSQHSDFKLSYFEGQTFNILQILSEFPIQPFLHLKIPKQETLGPFNWHVMGSNGCSRKAMKN